jgi:hypothetical protein
MPRVLENRVLRKIFGSKRDEETGSREDYITWSIMLCRITLQQISTGRSNKKKLDGQGMWHVWETGEVHTGFWWGNLRERDKWKDLGIDGWIIFK